MTMISAVKLGSISEFSKFIERIDRQLINAGTSCFYNIGDAAGVAGAGESAVCHFVAIFPFPNP